MVAVVSMVVVVNGEMVPVVVFGSVVAADAEAKIVIVFVHIIEKKTHLFNDLIFGNVKLTAIC